MRCPYCGQEIPDDAQFCSFCGKTITKQTMQSSEQVVTVPKMGRKMTAFTKGIIVILGIFDVIFILVVALLRTFDVIVGGLVLIIPITLAIVYLWRKSSKVKWKSVVQ